jgi:hypothetical protein
MSVCVVIKVHDDQDEGLSRTAIVSLIVICSGHKLSRAQAERTWDRTVHPFGVKYRLLTGYVKPQDGSSKRTAAGNIDLQREWNVLVDEMQGKVKAVTLEVLKDPELVRLMLPYLQSNLDEECLHSLGKNAKVVGSKSKKKHDNENASSRSVPIPHFLPCCL